MGVPDHSQIIMLMLRIIPSPGTKGPDVPIGFPNKIDKDSHGAASGPFVPRVGIVSNSVLRQHPKR